MNDSRWRADVLGTVTAQQVSVFCEMWGQPWMPYPLEALARRVSTESLQRRRIDIRNRFESFPPLVFEEWARTSILPDLRVEAMVIDVNPAGDNQSGLLINAVRRNDFGFLATQRYDESADESSDITVRQMQAVDLGRAIVDVLPKVAVSKPLADVNPPSVDPRSRSVLDDTPSPPPWRSPLDGARGLHSGFLQVRDGRDAERHLDVGVPRLLWADFAEHGRYVLTGQGMTAVDDAELKRLIDAMIGERVQAIRQRRGG
ncbi:hypothetical protein [Gordonia soli]|uniref:ESX secretion-associated protein EspG n=1 Tax=Gordonia soli NBRC 108243 TaxID=1223545 RepID=M0QL27_9ACTN|nr:hypothetical protein [Gordonia soli]GAC69345.1 hypothetical protein GS4_23_01420 [Gordonia soli NBRC 108243]